MNIRNTRNLKQHAAGQLQNAPAARNIVAIYSGLAIGLSALVTVVNYVLGLQIDQLGGLSQISTRTLLSTVQSVLPLVQSVVNLCLSVGFLAATLRIARGQYVSPKTLRLGFDRFWVLLRTLIFQGIIYSGLIFLSCYAGIMLYMVTPLSQDAVELLLPYLSDVSILDSTVMLDEAVYSQFAQMIWPAYVICGIVLLFLLVPVMYSYRMVHYVIIDKPRLGALAALRESKRMMQKNRLALLKLDLSMWWYYAALILATVVGYGDMLLPLLGIQLPWSENVGYFLFYGLYLAASFLIYYLLLGRVDVTYALAYEALKPEEKKPEGVVLGNIFQM